MKKSKKLKLRKINFKNLLTRNNVLTIVLVALIIGFLYSTYNFVHILHNQYKSNNIINKLQEENEKNVPIKKDEPEEDTPEEEEQYTYNFAKLKEQNADTVAWLEIPEADMSYPLVYTDNNSYYLNHSFDRSKNINGWVFINSLNNVDLTDQNTVIYGHNSLFKPIRKIFDSKNKEKFYIYIYKEDEIITYEVFSMYLTVSYDVAIIESELSEDLLREITNKSTYNFNVEVTSEDKILTLSTCYNDKTQRIIVHAKRLFATN